MKILSLSVLLPLACTALFAQADSTNSSSGKTNPTIMMDTTAMAKVYVIRSTGHVGSAVNLRVVVDDVMKCKVKNNRYAVVFVEPGMHMFNATSWDKGAREKEGLKMPVEAGKTYYMSMRIKPRFFETEIFLEEVTNNTAAPLLAKYKRDECN
jgi:hypothetical protein